MEKNLIWMEFDINVFKFQDYGVMKPGKYVYYIVVTTTKIRNGAIQYGSH